MSLYIDWHLPVPMQKAHLSLVKSMSSSGNDWSLLSALSNAFFRLVKHIISSDFVVLGSKDFGSWIKENEGVLSVEQFEL